MPNLSCGDGGQVENPPTRWEKMLEVAVGQGGERHISVEAMKSLSIPYYKLQLETKSHEYYMMDVRDEEGRVIGKQRVHLNAIPRRLLRVLYHTTSFRDRHAVLNVLFENGIVGYGRYPEYEIEMRKAMVAVDADGNLLEMPKKLESAIRIGDALTSAASIKAFYAPPRLRRLLYHTAPVERRSYYLLDEEERKAGIDTVFSEIDQRLWEQLLQREDNDGQILELTTQLETAILNEEIADVDDLREFDRNG